MLDGGGDESCSPGTSEDLRLRKTVIEDTGKFSVLFCGVGGYD